MTGTMHDPMDLLRQTLEDQFQLHTDQLSELPLASRQADRGGYDQEALAALIISSRSALADTANALRRMAEGTYGRCTGCADSISPERLEILPHARFCVSCQRAQAT